MAANAENVPVDTSLNTFIRNYAHLSGTKFMCLEGGCGCCVVNVSGLHPVTKETKSWSVNSCLFPVFACHGLDIKTVEALGNRKDGYHPIQERLAHMNGSQCGYCSPGMVMTMYSLMESKQGSVSMEEVEKQLGGNICRCTGYRPILDAFKSLTLDDKPEVPDIEELQFCPTTNTVCSAQCPVVACVVDKARPVRIVFENTKEWHKVFSVSDIFATLNTIGSKPYMFLGGNTAHGVYRRNESIQIFIDVNSVEELRDHYQTSDHLIIGGNVTLAELIEILRKIAKKLSGFSYCAEMGKHLQLAANPAVRNVGTIAGNLSIKNQHPEFPSDLYILLEAVGAKLTVAESLTTQSEVSPLQFIQLDMTKKLLKSVSLPGIVSQTYVFRSYRVAQRAQNAHAYVNAAFLLQFGNDKETVQSATLCFGGINPKFTHASRTEKLLVGKRLFDNTTIQQAINSLASEIQPDWILPDASADYRKNLAVSLFYKFLLAVAGDNNVLVDPRFKSGSTMLERPLSSGQQQYDTIKKNWPVTKYVPKLEGLVQASGEAKYTNDFPPFPGELQAAFVIATQPNTTIGKIDPADALRLPGVVGFFSASDIPGTNSFVANGMLTPFPDVEEIFCSGRVLFHGQAVGVIVAERFDQAVRAAKQVKIIYERVTDEPVCPTVKTILMHNTKKDVEDHLSHNNFLPTVEEQSVQQIQGAIEMYGQYHYPLETQTCLCVPTEDGMDVYAATQWIDLCQVVIAAALKVPQNSLNFTVRRLGGSYGGKLTRACHIACACALAAHLTKRPVRFVLTIESNMETIGKRCGCFSSYQVKVNDEGYIKQLSNNFLQDYGSSLNDDVLMFTNEAFKLSYDSSKWTFTGKPVLTDAPSNTWTRGPGMTEGIAMVETIMEHIAWVTGVDPMQVRLRNMHSGSKFHVLMPQFRQDVQYDKRKQFIDEFNATNRWRKRGIAIVPMQYPLVHFGAIHAQVSIYAKDGTVSISHGGIEVGQGINTKVAQVAAFTLGISLEKISIKPTTSMTSPNAAMTAASMTSDAVCYAVIKACEILNTRLQPIKKELKNAPWEKVTQTCYTRDIDLSVLYQYKKADLKPYSIWGLSCAEIEIDVLTGNIQLTRVDILEDTGESLSPGIDVGQIEGAYVMGIGYWLTESLIYDMTNGALLTNRSWNYKPPGAKDIPVDFRIRLIQTGDNPSGVLRSKATGEPAICMAVVVVLALRYALRSAQKDAGCPDDWIPLGSATTPEQIFLKSSNTFEQYKLQ
uniref:FAD-binding PCMH-type domain-containing protein n=1 Tax=Anopheles funestus TaxID=62324 RepID=A0A1Y9HF24_ANOFN